MKISGFNFVIKKETKKKIFPKKKLNQNSEEDILTRKGFFVIFSRFYFPAKTFPGVNIW